MNIQPYDLNADKQLTVFTFHSKGVKGKVTKIIQFSVIDSAKNFYTLSLGDFNSRTGKPEPKTTNNADAKEVLATVIGALHAFDYFPGSWIYVNGSSPGKTRLYQMGINHFFDVLDDGYQIYGESETGWVPFEQGTNYVAFLLNGKVKREAEMANGVYNKMVVRRDASLNKFSGEELFPQKLLMAKEALKKFGLPKNIKNKKLLATSVI